MSLATWKKEFYPKPANKVSKKDALAHSIQKWTGLQKSHLKRHGVHFDYGFLRDDKNADVFPIDDDTCALCQHYLYSTEPGCPRCPLAVVLNDRCDARDDFPYRIFRKKHDTKPMLVALKKAAKP